MTLGLDVLLPYAGTNYDALTAAFPNGITFEGELSGEVGGELNIRTVERLATFGIDLVEMVDALELADLSGVRAEADAERDADLARLSEAFRMIVAHAQGQDEPLRGVLVAAAHAPSHLGRTQSRQRHQDAILRGAWRLLAEAE